MANRGWDKVRRSIGLYPVPPIRPGGKWRPPGADLPPRPPPSEVQSVVNDLTYVMARLSGVRSGCAYVGVDEFKDDFLELRKVAEHALHELGEWQRRTANKRAKYEEEHEYAFHRKQAALADERREKYRLERLELAKKKRAKEKRERERAKKAAEKAERAAKRAKT